MRLEEIEARVAAIRTECEADGADLTALNSELDALLEERKAILEAAEQRKALLDKADINGSIIQRKNEDKPMEERIFTVEDKEYRDAWVKQLQGKDLSDLEQRAIVASGAAVPTSVAQQFFAAAQKNAPMLSEITLLHAAGNLKIGVQSANDSTSTHTENQSISASNSAIGYVELGGKEFFSLITISEAAEKMSIDAFTTWIVDILAADLAAGIENYIWNNATNGIAAITYTADTNMIKNSAGPKYADLCKIVALLPARYDAGANGILTRQHIGAMSETSLTHRVSLSSLLPKTVLKNFSVTK